MKNEYRIQKIDASSIYQHSDLDEKDDCYYLADYASHQGYKHSGFNQTIFNFKKPINDIADSFWIP